MVGVLRAYCNQPISTKNVKYLIEIARSKHVSRTAEDASTVKERRPRRLPDDQRRAIVKAYRAGRNLNQIAKDHGIHRTTVARVLEEEGTQQRHRGLTTKQVKQATELYAEGLSTLKIGRRLGVSANAVWNALRTAGIELRDPHGRPKS